MRENGLSNHWLVCSVYLLYLTRKKKKNFWLEQIKNKTLFSFQWYFNGGVPSDVNYSLCKGYIGCDNNGVRILKLVPISCGQINRRLFFCNKNLVIRVHIHQWILNNDTQIVWNKFVHMHGIEK